MLKADLNYTKQIRLNKIIDPLSLRSLKVMEDQFFQGITTQTSRLRYYTLLTWWYDQIDKGNLEHDQVFRIEKIFTLIAKNHHLHEHNRPLGIRNSRNAGDFLKENQSFKVDSYTKFGVPNRVELGYADFYYINPIRALGTIKDTQDKENSSTNIGKKISNIFANLAKKQPFEMIETSRRKLSSLSKYCVCRETITEEEQKLWRYAFFGHKMLTSDNDIEFDIYSYDEFYKGQMLDSKKFQNWINLSNASNPIQDLSKKAGIIQRQDDVKRGYSLLLVIKVIDEAKPDNSGLNQTFRDVIYFKQVLTGKNNVHEVNFGKLEFLRSLWEVYVHNLYFISIMEGIFCILLKFLETKPFGTTINQVVDDIDEQEIYTNLQDLGLLKNWKNVEELMTFISTKIPEKSSLKDNLNERRIFLKSQEASTTEEQLASFFALLLLLKHRYDLFSNEQKEMLCSIEGDLGNLAPRTIYKHTLQGTFLEVYSKLLTILKNRHRLIAVEKYIEGTRSWLLTEENGLLFHYGKKYKWKPYRESKWTNIVELLYDLGLIDKEEDRVTTNQLGSKWMQKIT